VGLRGDLGAGLPVSEPSNLAFGLGFSGAITAELEVLDLLGLDLQLGYTRLERKVSASGNAGTLLYVGAGARTHLPLDGARFVPWLDVTGGWGYSGGSRLVLSGTAGLSVRPLDRAVILVGVFVRFQQVLDLGGSSSAADAEPRPPPSNASVLSFGLSFELRQPRGEVAAAAVADSNVDRLEPSTNANADTDGDGLLDAADKCIEEKEDFDGIADKDGCPETDGDKDSVDDKTDACPNAAGKSGSKGCPTYPRIAVQADRLDLKDKITFVSESAKLTAESGPILDQLATVLTDRPGLCVLITAHTDNLRSEDVNLSLSGNQAQAVRAYLVKKGISVDRLGTRGFGEQKPLNKNRTPDEREQNRRIEILVNPCSEPL
jgi:outer membrane protein OmpA-like peptidoglycan-associated protein